MVPIQGEEDHHGVVEGTLRVCGEVVTCACGGVLVHVCAVLVHPGGGGGVGAGVHGGDQLACDQGYEAQGQLLLLGVEILHVCSAAASAGEVPPRHEGEGRQAGRLQDDDGACG